MPSSFEADDIAPLFAIAEHGKVYELPVDDAPTRTVLGVG